MKEYFNFMKKSLRWNIIGYMYVIMELCGVLSGFYYGDFERGNLKMPLIFPCAFVSIFFVPILFTKTFEFFEQYKKKL